MKLKYFLKSNYYNYEIVKEIPAKLMPQMVYIEGNNKEYWIAAFVCPCGCQQVIYLNLLKSCNPNWKVKIHWFHGISILPSINRKVGCKSHFVLQNGKIKWCYSYKY